jgi:hypothetical protein
MRRDYDTNKLQKNRKTLNIVIFNVLFDVILGNIELEIFKKNMALQRLLANIYPNKPINCFPDHLIQACVTTLMNVYWRDLAHNSASTLQVCNSL